MGGAVQWRARRALLACILGGCWATVVRAVFAGSPRGAGGEGGGAAPSLLDVLHSQRKRCAVRARGATLEQGVEQSAAGVTLGGDTAAGGAWLKGDMHFHGPVQEFKRMLPEYNQYFLAPENGTTAFVAWEALMRDSGLTGKTGGMQHWPATILPFPGLVNRAAHLKNAPTPPLAAHRGLTLWGDRLYDQAVVDWDYIMEDLKSQGKAFDFAVFLTHDLPGSDIDSGWKAECQNRALMCATGREFRLERSESCGKRLAFTVKSAGNGIHSGDFDHIDPGHEHDQGFAQLKGFYMALHPNARPQDRLQQGYINARAEATGIESGTPCLGNPDLLNEPGHELNAIEVWNGWFPHIGARLDIEGYGDGFVPSDLNQSTFAVNKWDAALSRGDRLWATASADAFAKGPEENQLWRLREKNGECTGTEAEKKKCAMYVRAVPSGGGFIKVWKPSHLLRNMNNVVEQVKGGHFYAAAANDQAKAPEIVVEKVETEEITKTYSVTLADAHDVTCYAVTNHGRAAKIEPDGKKFTQVGLPEGCSEFNPAEESKGSDQDWWVEIGKKLCTYLRVECRRCGDALQRADCAHVWLQPMYFDDGHKALKDHFENMKPDAFKPNWNQDEFDTKVMKWLEAAPKWKEDALPKSQKRSKGQQDDERKTKYNEYMDEGLEIGTHYTGEDRDEQCNAKLLDMPEFFDH